MRSIWKYSLTVQDGPQRFEIPAGGIVHHVATQGDRVCMWVEVNTDPMIPRQDRAFVVYGSGQLIADGERYVGTACDDLGYVWHVFEVRL